MSRKKSTKVFTNKFKVGDVVVGTKEASEHYTITFEGWVGTVTRIFSNDDIEVRGYCPQADTDNFDVSSEYFVLSKEHSFNKLYLTLKENAE